MEKILDIIEGISYEKGLPIESVTDAVKDAVMKVAKESLDATINYDVEIDKSNIFLHRWTLFLIIVISVFVFPC